jgi:hypothetical protein
MQLMKVSESVPDRLRVAVYLVDASGDPVTGASAPALSLSANGDAFVPPIPPTWVEVGDGVYYLEFLQTHVATLGFLSIRISDALAPPAQFVTQTIFVQIVAFDPYTIQTNPNVNVVSWGDSALTAPDTVVAFPNSYQALVAVDFETALSGKDEYTIVWADKAGPRAHADVTSPTITLYNRAGTAIVTNAAMTAVGTIGAFSYDTSTNRIPLQETWIAEFKATIDGPPTRTWRQAVAHP